MRRIEELYRDVILDHGKAPRNQGRLEGATHAAVVKNPLCGDRVTLQLRVRDGEVVEARFEARACLITQASASLLTEAVRGRTVTEALGLAEVVAAALPERRSELAVDVPVALPAALEPLAGAREFPARRACVMLAWSALRAALASH